MPKWDRFLDDLERRMDESDSGGVRAVPVELPTCDDYTQLWGRLLYQYNGLDYYRDIAHQFNYAARDELAVRCAAVRRQYVDIAPADLNIILKHEHFYTPAESARCAELLKLFDAANPLNKQRRYDWLDDAYLYQNDDELTVLHRDDTGIWWQLQGLDLAGWDVRMRGGPHHTGNGRRVHVPVTGRYGVVTFEHGSNPVDVRFDDTPALKESVNPDDLEALQDAYEPIDDK